METNNPTIGSTRTTKTRGFPSPPYDGFGFSAMGLRISRQNGTTLPPGARLAHFEGFTHGKRPPEWRLKVGEGTTLSE